MKISLFLFLILFYAQNSLSLAPKLYALGEILIKVSPVENSHTLKTLGNVESISPKNGIYLIKRPLIEQMEYSLKILSQNPKIILAEPNYVYNLTNLPNDIFFERQWSLQNTGQNIQGWEGTPGIDINLFKAWNITHGSKDIIIAITDTGLDLSYTDIQKNLWVNLAEKNGLTGIDDDQNGYIDDIHGYDFSRNIPELRDSEGHGSHVTSLIGAESNNREGISGIIPETSLMILKIFGGDTTVVGSAIKAIDYAIDKKVRVINASWGGAGDSQLLKEAIERANMANITFVAAAGNNYANNDKPDWEFYPANYNLPNVIAVASHDNTGKKSSYSNYGPQKVHLAAPGEHIFAYMDEHWGEIDLFPKGYYFLSGTSMSAPHVTATIALMLSVNPELTPIEIRNVLIDTSTCTWKWSEYIQSCGILNTGNAVESVLLQ